MSPSVTQPLRVAVCLLLLVALGCGAPASESASDDPYTCPMHPEYVSDRPGDCPICNMTLVRRSTLGAGSEPAGNDGGRAGVELSGEGRALAGVVTAVAHRESLARTIRAVGTVVADERRQVKAATKVSGWVEKLRVSSTGEFVRKGQPAMEIYSPELLAAQGEYLLARDAAARFAGSALPEVRRGGQDLLIAARRRLELFDVPESMMLELDRTRTARRTVELAVPATGFVTSKEVIEGQEVRPGMELFTVTDLSRVWVEASFFESEARFLAIGTRAELVLPFEGGSRRPVRVSYLYPTLDPAARTLTARFELDNPGFKLRPGMYVDVELTVESREQVVVPDSAVLDSGVRRIVFVESSPGRFDPREVETGERSDGMVAILRGVEDGERVATRANFLLDAESRLRAALPPAGESPATPHAEHR